MSNCRGPKRGATPSGEAAPLPRGLGRVDVEVWQVQVNAAGTQATNGTADFGALAFVERVHQAHLAIRRFHDDVVGHHFPAAERFVIAVLRVDRDANQHILVGIALLRGRGQRILGWTGTTEDIEEKRRTEQARRDCTAFLAATWCGPSKWPARVDVGTLRGEQRAAVRDRRRDVGVAARRRDRPARRAAGRGRSWCWWSTRWGRRRSGWRGSPRAASSGVAAAVSQPSAVLFTPGVALSM